jgi:SAM-dependent methyltransferase
MREYVLVRVRPYTVVLIVAVLIAAFVAEEAVRTLRILEVVERERDAWQRPDDVVAALDLRPGQTIVDLGAGAGYFALKMAPKVSPGGQVLAVDLRRQSLAFLWMRARWRGLWHVRTIAGRVDDPRLPDGAIDAVLIANTYHELAAPEAILGRLSAALRPGGRLVILDRRPRVDNPGGLHEHGARPETALEEVGPFGFRLVVRHDSFIDQPADDDVWWLMVFEKL